MSSPTSHTISLRYQASDNKNPICLAVTDDPPKVGSQIYSHPCSPGDPSQTFTYDESQKLLKFQNFCIGPNDAEIGDGIPIQLQDCTDKTYQSWIMMDTPDMIRNVADANYCIDGTNNWETDPNAAVSIFGCGANLNGQIFDQIILDSPTPPQPSCPPCPSGQNRCSNCPNQSSCLPCMLAPGSTPTGSSRTWWIIGAIIFFILLVIGLVLLAYFIKKKK